MGDMILPLVLAGVALLLVSVMVAARLSSTGVPRARVWLAVIEVWLTFGVIVTLLALMRGMLGDVTGANVGEELAGRWAHFAALPLLGQAGIVAMLAGVIGLFAHLVNSLRGSEHPEAGAGSVEEEKHDE